MLKELQKRNPDIEILDVTDAAFATFGRVIHDLDISEIMQEAKKTADPESGSSYVPSLATFEKLPIAKWIEDRCFGGVPSQIGYCWGHNQQMNATEWHSSDEINIAIKPLVLILGHVWDIHENKIDASKFKAFYLPAGTAVRVYATTLHFCPCEVNGEGFGCVVALPLGTNTELTEKGQDPLLFRKNKWILAHVENEALIARGVVPGITGINYRILY